jgi:hypothetical protein
MIKNPKPVAAASVVACLALGSLLMAGLMDHRQADGGCPFMPGEQAACQMDAFDHMSAWQSAFAAAVPAVFALSLLAAAAILALRRWHPPPDAALMRALCRRREEAGVVPLYQELFSSGILNPKAP